MSSASGREKGGKYKGDVEFGQITKGADGCKVVLQLVAIKFLLVFWWFFLFVSFFFVCLFVVCLFGGGCGGFLLVKSRGQTGKNTLSKFVTE